MARQIHPKVRKDILRAAKSPEQKELLRDLMVGPLPEGRYRVPQGRYNSQWMIATAHGNWVGRTAVNNVNKRLQQVGYVVARLRERQEDGSDLLKRELRKLRDEERGRPYMNYI